jgi:hypothetical protein
MTLKSIFLRYNNALLALERCSKRRWKMKVRIDGIKSSMRKSRNFQLTLWVLVYFFSSFALEATEGYQKAFYAISSLTFYLGETISDLSANKKSNEEKIIFSETDVAQLWHTASSYPAITDDIKKARDYYYEVVSSEQSQTSLIEGCKKTYLILHTLWNMLNPYTVKEKAAVDIRAAAANSKYPNFDDNPYIDNTMRKRMRPYLLPLKNKLKVSLDEIFDTSRAIQNTKSFAKAGFITLFHQRHSLIRVAEHGALPGYLLKVYLDSDVLDGRPGWECLTRRCQGAENLRRLIKEKKLEHFSVPDKWIYPLSFSNIPPATNSKSVQPVILVVTDMDLVSRSKSRKIWRTKVTHKHLDELYCILSHGLASKTLPQNIPYTRSGKFACIDTEDPHKKINFNAVRRYLSPQMRAYWEELVRKGGKN